MDTVQLKTKYDVITSLAGTLNGKPVKFICKRYSRGGYKSSELDMFIIGNKRYTPFAQKVYKFHPDMISMLKIAYSGPVLKNLVYQENPLLKLIPR